MRETDTRKFCYMHPAQLIHADDNSFQLLASLASALSLRNEARTTNAQRAAHPCNLIRDDALDDGAFISIPGKQKFSGTESLSDRGMQSNLIECKGTRRHWAHLVLIIAKIRRVPTACSCAILPVPVAPPTPIPRCIFVTFSSLCGKQLNCIQ